jgi:SNF2 family DNA or RNA helicase
LFARLDRNGQTNPVSVHIHVVEDSLDDMMARMLDKKSNILSEVLDGKSLQKEDMLSSMIEKAIK